ncbi:protein TonB [Winogradskyella wandonensis]|uniref:Protein TonB n=1 Tax=Winogradskyella wandonensis TaxID=1442586 RepID=A0A4R1KSJ2_9FLAO|nr:energy transducer TonB [Winogradskyella wandonensis]TCK67567.1 protein TonB [Winogradskyella wandonensis]
MKNQSQNNKSVGQNASEVRKSQKHEVNLQKNSTLYFQIGLILCLLGTFTLFEMRFESKIIKPERPEIDVEVYDVAMTDVKVYEPEVKQEAKKTPSKKLLDTYVPQDNDTPEPKVEDIITPDIDVSDKKLVKIEDIKDPIDTPVDNFNIKNVEFVPIFPGCEKYNLNSEREKCLNEKMNKLVQRKFNTDIASDYGLSGEQKIYVTFTVDKTGHIKDIKTRAPHPKLQQEAERIANKIPKMEPGKMGITPVNVMYSLPIKFKVQD